MAPIHSFDPMIFLSLSPNLTKIVCISGIEGTFKFLPIEVFNINQLIKVCKER